MSIPRSILAMSLGLAISIPDARAAEGLWTLEQAARPDVRNRLGLSDHDRWEVRLPSAILRFSSGESGVLTSAHGLVVTIRSAAAACLYAASIAGTDLVAKGFWADDGNDLKCPDLSLEQSISSEDVTERLRSGLDRGQPIPTHRIAAIEDACRAASGLECRVAPLYSGGIMRLHRIRRHTDVRLVFAPEYRAAAFGPASARMVFPRYSLDVAFFRIYEGDKPLQAATSIPWRTTGAANDTRVLVASFPGVTERTLPWRFLETLAAAGYRLQARMAREQAQALMHVGSPGKQGESVILEGTRARLERLAAELRSAMALLQNRPIKRKQKLSELERRNLFTSLNPNPAKAVWASAVTASDAYEKLYRRYMVVEGDRVPPFGQLFDIGRQLVRWTAQRKMPEDQRLPEFQGANPATIERRLAAPIPLSIAAEQLLLALGLQRLRGELGPKDPFVQPLDSEPPADQAARIVAGTKLMDVAVRKQILATGELGEASDDPLVMLVQHMESEGQLLRRAYDRDVRRELTTHLAAVGERLGAPSDGMPFYADASDDLRLSSGRIRGFLDFGREVPAQVFLGGLLVRATRARPGSLWELPDQWKGRQSQVNLTKPINFILDADVGSGAPGGAVFDQGGNLIGIVIDTTLKSAINRFQFRGGDARAVAVHTAGLVEALRQVYKAGRLADEVTKTR